MTLLSRRAVATARRHIAVHLRGSADGITMAIFAIALVVLLGFVALGIDGARGFDERREAQNAADHAAIAAAYASCTSTSTDPAVLVAAAIAAGEASALENGYDDNETTNDVEIDVAPGAAPGVGDHKYTASVETTIETTFAKILGFGDLDTRGEATAEATGCDETAGGSVPAMHAGGTSCPGGSSYKNIEISGNDMTINGLSRSNGGFRNQGNNSEFTNMPASVEYVLPPFQGGSNTYVGPESLEAISSPQWPAGYESSLMTGNTMWDFYKAARKIIPGGLTADKFNVNTDGIYYTERADGVDVESISGNRSFILVSKNGPIRMGNEHDGTYTAYPNPAGTPANVLVVSGFSHSQPCDQFAIERSGQDGVWNGVFWAPKAAIRFSGQSNTVNGGVIAWTVHLNGNYTTLNGGTGTGAQSPFVQMTN